LADLLRRESTDTVPSARGLTLLESIREFCSEQWGKYAAFVVENGAKRREHDEASKAITLRRLADNPHPAGVARWVPVDEQKKYEKLVQPEPPGVGWQILFDAYRELARIAESGRLEGRCLPKNGGIEHVEIPSDAWRCAADPTFSELLASEVGINGERFVDVRFRSAGGTMAGSGERGRPDTARRLYLAEAEARATRGELTDPVMSHEAKRLEAWMANNHPPPLVPKPALKTIENNLSQAWRRLLKTQRAAVGRSAGKQRTPRK